MTHPDTQTADSRSARICLSVSSECCKPALAAAVRSLLDDRRLASIRLLNNPHNEPLMKRAAEFLRQSVGGRDIAVVIDSRINLAAELGLDGAHLPDGPARVRQARAQLGPDMIVGAFCGASRHPALLAGENGADYVSFGPVAQTDSGGGEIALPALFKWWNEFTVLPSMAEGGICRGNAGRFARLADFLLFDGADLTADELFRELPLGNINR